MSSHLRETDLALFASGDLGLWRSFRIRLHTAKCESCQARGEAFRLDRERLRHQAEEMPAGVDWNSLAAEMTANIRVGLAAGECVDPRKRDARKRDPRKKAAHAKDSQKIPLKIKVNSFPWRPVAGIAAVAILFVAAFWLNFPSSDRLALSRVMRNLAHGGGGPIFQETGPVVEASSTGMELRENGSSLGVSQGALRPVAVSVNAQGSASARYVDADTGQVTITSVYVQQGDLQ
ncbi:MAG TPA: hypothetical protein VFW83_06215 [Bryobacteraceae bacterium]|nr:hypothetical protein [Bryobacteraceae bacterium]